MRMLMLASIVFMGNLIIVTAQSQHHEAYEFSYESKGDDGTLTLSGYKSADPENMYVDFTFNLESDSPFPSGEDTEVRLCFEYALND